MIDTLTARAADMGIAITCAQARKFALFHDMLTRANENMNLTRVSADIGEAIDRNYLDSLSPLAPCLLDGAASVIDVGSGAGFPGIPLSIMLPDARFTLIDSLDKRVAFLSEVISALKLNAVAIRARAEDAGKSGEMRESFDVAVSRAVAPVSSLAEYMLPLVKIGGRALMYKGPAYDSELSDGTAAISLLGGGEARVHGAYIPGRDWEHYLLDIPKIAETPQRYPRRAGIPEKRPLR